MRRPSTPNGRPRTSPRLRIVLTGGGSGIGAAIARDLAAEGHAIAILGRREEPLRQIASVSSAIWAMPCNVSDERQVGETVARITSRWPSVDALINAAAVIGPIGLTTELKPEDVLRVWKINVGGTLRMIIRLLPLLKKAPHPCIINFSGGGAFSPFPRYSAYAMSKAAVVRLTENLAIELAEQGIAVNAIAPGFQPTDMHHATLAAGPERAGRDYYERTRQLLHEGPTDRARPFACVRFLLSQQAEGLTGKTISAGFDPWDTAAFQQHLREIGTSELYTQRRINPVHLPAGPLRDALEAPSARPARPRRQHAAKRAMARA